MADLKEYKKKRDFRKTPEPKGIRKNDKGERTFVVQRHDATRLHFDFRLEYKGVLLSWAIPKEPMMDPNVKRLAIHVEDHPLSYGSFEGKIPEGQYGAGDVQIWDSGTYTYPGIEMQDTNSIEQRIQHGIDKGHIVVELHGEKLQGEFSILKLNDPKQKDSWLFFKNEHSVAEKKELQRIEIEKENINSLIRKYKLKKIKIKREPMMASIEEKPFDNLDWVYEIKYDGYRILADINKDDIKLITRKGQDYLKKFERIGFDLKRLKSNIVLDGEIVVLNDKGISDFSLLKNFLSNGEGVAYFYVFDILEIEGRSLENLELIERKKILEELVSDFGKIRVVDFIEKFGKEFFSFTSENFLEGIIAKNKLSKYKPGIRSKEWLKIKSSKTQDAIIVGYSKLGYSKTETNDSFASLALAVYKDKKLIYIGNVGSGLTSEIKKELFQKFKEQKKLEIEIPNDLNRQIVFIKPEIVCEVSYLELTEENLLRHPVFLRIRDDKKLQSIQLETAKDSNPKKNKKKEILENIENKYIKISNPDKKLWKEISKKSYIEFIKNISEFILPYLKDRPLSTKRFPDGIEGESFFQKDMPYAPSWTKTKVIHSESAERDLKFLICNDKETLVYLANLAVIEFHPWHSRIDSAESPDYIVFDLDPNKTSFDKIINTAKKLHEILEKYEIPAFPKTSGAEGLHVYVPLKPKYDYDQALIFAKIIADLLNKSMPDITSLDRSPNSRKGKVYIDVLQNRKGQTIVAPYSPRPNKTANVSAPLEWSELNSKLKPTQFTQFNILERLEKKGDLFANLYKERVDLEKILDKLKS